MMPNEAVQKPHSHPPKACSQGVANPEWSFDVSSRQCAAFLTSYRAPSACTVPRGRFSACTPRLLGIPMVGQLLDVVHQAVQAPLRIDFGLAAQREAVQSLDVPDVAKHRLHGADALAVQVPASG